MSSSLHKAIAKNDCIFLTDTMLCIWLNSAHSCIIVACIPFDPLLDELFTLKFKVIPKY